MSLAGRISRKAYWLTYALLVCIQSALLSQLVGGALATYHDFAAMISLPILLLTIYINIAISVKRLHDVGYSGFLALAIIIPVVNLAFTVWVGILPGTPDPNPYGEATDIPPA